MKKYEALGVVVVLAAVAIFWFLHLNPSLPVERACTKEAKICLDGSTVGRTGPNCEFAACPTGTATSTTPTPTPTPGSTSATSTPIAIGKSATVRGTTIGVLELLEDSRCPVDVQCIQAGTVRVRASIDAMNRDFVFTLGKMQVVGTSAITLVAVVPAEKKSTKAVLPGDYRFIFTVYKTSPFVPADSGVSGTVVLGPTCPVERNPPDTGCADKPYATAITVYRTGSSVPLMIGNSDAAGAFHFSLTVGAYTLQAKGGAHFPTCSPAPLTVKAGVTATTTIRCDTGIR